MTVTIESNSSVMWRYRVERSPLSYRCHIDIGLHLEVYSLTWDELLVHSHDVLKLLDEERIILKTCTLVRRKNLHEEVNNLLCLAEDKVLRTVYLSDDNRKQIELIIYTTLADKSELSLSRVLVETWHDHVLLTEFVSITWKNLIRSSVCLVVNIYQCRIYSERDLERYTRNLFCKSLETDSLRLTLTYFIGNSVSKVHTVLKCRYAKDSLSARLIHVSNIVVT